MRQPKPERHPLRPPILPPPLDQLARAEVKPLSLNPESLPPEAYLLGRVEALAQQVANLEKTADRIEAAVMQMKEAHSALGWKVSGALASAIGALAAAAWSALKTH